MLVSAEHLYKMQNIRKIVEDVSFAIEEKDRIALVGINGTGKSTLLRVIAGKEKAEPGEEKGGSSGPGVDGLNGYADAAN